MAEVRALEQASGPNLLIMGSGSIVSQLSQARLIDGYQVVVQPVVLGSGKSMFDSVKDRLELRLQKTRVFTNGNRGALVRNQSLSAATARGVVTQGRFDRDSPI